MGLEVSDIISLILSGVIAIATVVYAVVSFFQFKENKKARQVAFITYLSSIFDYIEDSAPKYSKTTITESAHQKTAFLLRYFGKDVRDLIKFSERYIEKQINQKK